MRHAVRVFVLLFVVGACGSQPQEEPIVFDPCGPVTVAATTATADQLASIDAAISMWQAHGATHLARGDQPELPAPDIAVVFRESSGPMYGFYDGGTATVYVNLRIDDPSQRTITIAHELGHALGLEHVEDDARASVMNPGNVTIGPNDGDRDALSRFWGCPTDAR